MSAAGKACQELLAQRGKGINKRYHLLLAADMLY
jgi:hypothetical protein